MPALLGAPAPAIALDGDPGNVSCGLFLTYITTDPPYYEVFQSWLQGFAAGRQGSGGATPIATLLPAVTAFCQAQPDVFLSKAAEAVVKK